MLWEWLTPARPDAARRPPAAHRRALSLRRSCPPDPTPEPDPAGPAPARPGRSGRPGLPLLVTDHADERTANFLSALAGVYTFYHDPGELSAAFVWARAQRLLLTPRPPARFIIGGWTPLVDGLERRARELGEALVQGQMPIRPGESSAAAASRLERLLDESFDGWRERVTWRRRQVMDGRSGAVDLPGTTWRDRPAIDRGDGVFLCGDQVAADGCLSEVSFASAIDAGRRAMELSRGRAVAHAA
ncbi:MAG TPA: hypothetical protein VHV28_02125 [Solirubrobacteraceae bacterium]|nr:hypothetical protein [Solirubrobacteraceae bacterium]